MYISKRKVNQPCKISNQQPISNPKNKQIIILKFINQKKKTQIYATMQFVVAIFIYFFTKKEMIFFIKIGIHQYNTNSKLLKTKKINLI
jgi:ATP-dependent Clp protease adapter protein ClpS